MKKIHLTVGVVALIAVGAVSYVVLARTAPSPYASLSNRELAVLCDADMSEDFHIHQTLSLEVNGEAVEVPANIGVTETCMTAIHTHTPDGVIHVESPEKRDYTLGDFFAVWDVPFTKDQFMQYQANETHVIVLKVNGMVVDTYENTILRDSDRISISYEKR